MSKGCQWQLTVEDLLNLVPDVRLISHFHFIFALHIWKRSCYFRFIHRPATTKSHDASAKRAKPVERAKSAERGKSAERAKSAK